MGDALVGAPADGGRDRPVVVRAKLRPPPASGLRRERLDRLLSAAWNHPVTVVWGPAGSGKTTLLSQFAAAADAPTIWYRLDAEDTRPSVMLASLHLAFTEAVA